MKKYCLIVLCTFILTSCGFQNLNYTESHSTVTEIENDYVSEPSPDDGKDFSNWSAYETEDGGEEFSNSPAYE